MRSIVAPHTARKWWYRWIRTMNWFAFRYYWFVWLFFIASTAILLYFILTHKDKTSCDTTRIEKSIEIINKQLDSCCSCTSGQATPSTPLPPTPPGVPCDTDQKSGGQGRYDTVVVLGNQPGMVELTFDAFSVPDKIEVFYEDRRIASSYDCPNNQNGMIGGEYGSGPCILRFNYRYHQDPFVNVVVSAPNDGTSWRYFLSCPR